MCFAFIRLHPEKGGSLRECELEHRDEGEGPGTRGQKDKGTGIRREWQRQNGDKINDGMSPRWSMDIGDTGLGGLSKSFGRGSTLAAGWTHGRAWKFTCSWELSIVWQVRIINL